ncbi:MAG: hypothetical protein IAI50_20835, partial [Candidatus Eremiobacteraeota bacterium]|nr:hypothetical protein [Candidatus Eremiobacteraeota bacterium]
MPELPARPSAEYLRKQAKRLARERKVRVAEAQRILANDYGFPQWSAMLHHVATIRSGGDEPLPPLVAAIRAGDVEAVRKALADGANPRSLGVGAETPLHMAARRRGRGG